MTNRTYTWGEGGRHVEQDQIFRWSQVRYELAAVPVVETVIAGKFVEDWSGCRSPSRAMRRAGQGHKQHNKMVFKPGYFQIGDTLYVHPVVMKQLSDLLSKRMDDMMRDAILGVKP